MLIALKTHLGKKFDSAARSPLVQLLEKHRYMQDPSGLYEKPFFYWVVYQILEG